MLAGDVRFVDQRVRAGVRVRESRRDERCDLPFSRGQRGDAWIRRDQASAAGGGEIDRARQRASRLTRYCRERLSVCAQSLPGGGRRADADPSERRAVVPDEERVHEALDPVRPQALALEPDRERPTARLRERRVALRPRLRGDVDAGFRPIDASKEIGAEALLGALEVARRDRGLRLDGVVRRAREDGCEAGSRCAAHLASEALPPLPCKSRRSSRRESRIPTYGHYD